MAKQVSYKVNRGRGGPRKSRGRKKKVVMLEITSLIDILTILLVFLIKNISFDIERNSQPEGMKLPTSFKNEKNLLKDSSTLLVKIYEDRILYGLNNSKVGSLDDFVNNDNVKKALFNIMKDDAQKIRETNKEPVVLLQADEKVKCKYITSFMQLSASSSFHKVFFSAIKTENRKL